MRILDLAVAWTGTSPLSLRGNAGGYDFDVELHRWGELHGAAVMQLKMPPGESDERRVVPLPDSMADLIGCIGGVNGKECGALRDVRVSVNPGVQDMHVLQAHVGVDKVDDLFTAAGRISWADLIGEGG